MYHILRRYRARCRSRSVSPSVSTVTQPTASESASADTANVLTMMTKIGGSLGCSGGSSALHSDIKPAYLESAGLIVHLGLRRLGWGCSRSRSTRVDMRDRRSPRPTTATISPYSQPEAASSRPGRRRRRIQQVTRPTWMPPSPRRQVSPHVIPRCSLSSVA